MKISEKFDSFFNASILYTPNYYVALTSMLAAGLLCLALPSICVIVGTHASRQEDLSCHVTPLKKGSLRVQHVTVGTGRPEPSTFN